MANMKLTVITGEDNANVSIALHGTLVGVGIAWGDTQTSTPGSTPDVYTNIYATAGTYYVEISGTFTGYGWENTEPANNMDVYWISEVTDWGDNIANLTSLHGAFAVHSQLESVPTLPIGNGVLNMSRMFKGCSSFNQNISDWDVSAVENMSYMFYNAFNFNQDIGGWIVNAVTDMSNMFGGENITVAFNGDISGWDIGAVENMSNMLNFTEFSTDNYDALLNAWSVLPSIQVGVNFSTSAQYSSAGAVARGVLTDSPNSWVITDGLEIASFTGTPMKLTVDTTLGLTAEVALNETLSDVVIDWGDTNTTNVGSSPNRYSHTYSDTPGVHTIEISGTFSNFGWSLKPQTVTPIITAVTDWGDNLSNLRSLDYAFYNHYYLTSVPTLLSNNITTMYSMFQYASIFNQDISDWDVSAVTNMNLMFQFATAFNQNISDWAVNGVTGMSGMFNYTNFNKPLNWGNKTSQLQYADYMFDNATVFNQDISGWNVSNVYDLSRMFDNATSFSTTNYTALLIGWAAQTVQSGVIFDAPSTDYYSTAHAAKDILTLAPNSWIITDGEELEAEPSPLLLCWQLTAEKTDGQIFQLNGDGPFPKVIDVPDTVILNTVLLVDEGVEIDKSEYQINVI